MTRTVPALLIQAADAATAQNYFLVAEIINEFIVKKELKLPHLKVHTNPHTNINMHNNCSRRYG